jgi:hypothetical protein
MVNRLAISVVVLGMAAVVASPTQAGTRSSCARHRHCHRHRRASIFVGRPAGFAQPVPQSVGGTRPVDPGVVITPLPTRGDVKPPSFGGVTSAFACTPGPQQPGQTTPFNLSWEPAVDDIDPPSAIVYDVYLSEKAGGEDFSNPTWTTDPGAKGFRTPGLPSHGTFYFVVRARDRAGNEDSNTVELQGSDPCV